MPRWMNIFSLYKQITVALREAIQKKLCLKIYEE